MQPEIVEAVKTFDKRLNTILDQVRASEQDRADLRRQLSTLRDGIEQYTRQGGFLPGRGRGGSERDPEYIGLFPND